MGGAIPEGFRDKQEEKYSTKGNDHGQDPKNPAPRETANDDGTDKGNQVLAAKQKKSINTDPVGSLMEEEDFGNCG